MKILEDYSALSNLSNERNVYKIQHESGICCYKTKSVQEIELMIKIGDHPHLPKLIDYDLDEGWLIKEWCPGDTIDKRYNSFWDVNRIRELYAFTESLFKFLHPHNLVLQDFKPQNVSYGSKFMYFDLDWVVPATHVFNNTLGSKKHSYKSYESLYSVPISSTNDDYFSFANIVYNALIGPPQWSNSKKDPMEAHEQYDREYEEFVKDFTTALINIGLEQSEINFITDCFSPLKHNRPKEFNWINYSSDS